MPGFMISSKRTSVALNDPHDESYIKGTLQIDGGGTVLRSTLNKFLGDKAFSETENYVFVLDGYLLNKQELFEIHNVEDVCSLIISAYEKNGEAFFTGFRGCFSGALYDKKAKKWIVYTNQIGDSPIFYCQAEDKFVVGSQVTYLFDWCKENGIGLSFNESCAYQMLTFGYIATDETYANQIKRLHGGDYLIWKNNDLQIKAYHRFEKHPERFSGISEDEIVNEIDRGFCKAVQLEWDKDGEYGYSHLADLSGGLDSRMNVWVAHELSKKKATILTYCKEGYMDEIVARQIAEYWKDDLVYKALDDATFLYDIDENTSMLGGLSFYSAITGGRRLLESLDMCSYGIEHTGMVGDVALGSFYHHGDDGEKKWPSGMYSERLREKLPSHVKKLDERYSDYEIYLMYVRGFHFACNTHLIRRHYTEVGSPFLNVDFLQLCFDIPVELRMRHYIYKKWIMMKYPDAAQFKWEKTGGKITESHIRTSIRNIVKKGPKKLLRILGKTDKISDGMNPIDYWISQNSDISDTLNNYMKDTVKEYGDLYSEDLLSDMLKLYNTGNASEQLMVITVLAATKLYFQE